MEADPSAAIQYQQIIHVHYERVMPPLVFGGTIGSWLWLYLIRSRRRSLEFLMVLAAAVFATAIVILTVTISLPLNDRLMTWDVAVPPPDFHATWAPWEQVNVARVILSMLALVLETGALAFPAGGGSSR